MILLCSILEKERIAKDIRENKVHCKCLLQAKSDIHIKKGENYGKQKFVCAKQVCTFHCFYVCLDFCNAYSVCRVSHFKDAVTWIQLPPPLQPAKRKAAITEGQLEDEKVTKKKRKTNTNEVAQQ